MKKIILMLFIVILMLMFSASFFVVERASAEMKKPEIAVGDYWEYELTVYFDESTYKATGKLEIKEITTISIDNVEYEVFKETGFFNLTRSYYNDYLELNLIRYLRTSDLTTVKSIFDSPQTGHEEYSYSPPVAIDWPLGVGKSWQFPTTKTTFLMGEISSEDIIAHNECLTESEITVPAGEFSCYVLKQWDNEIQNYTISFYSPAVGSCVRREVYNNNELTSIFVLQSYKYSGGRQDTNTNGDDNDGTPGFELVFVVCAIGLVLFWKRKNKMK